VAQIPITFVRYRDKDGYDRLRQYIFGSRYISLRPPRGVLPDAVAHFLRNELKPDSAPEAYQRALEAMRFYEVQGVASHLRTFLTGNEQTYRDVRRAAFIVQALGDAGSPDDARWGSEYLDRILVRKPAFAEIADLLLQTLLVLAPAGSTAAYEARLREEIARSRGSQDSRAMTEIRNNRLPGTLDLIAAKNGLLREAAGTRRSALVSIYLGQSDLSEPYLLTWAGRMIRRDAIAGDPAPIHAEFGRAIEESDEAFVIVRAAQAIVYLRGTLDARWHKRYLSSQPEEFQNFLWDDP
jgi:hypothetical protein